MPNILLLGATGMIGKALTVALSKEGYIFTAACRDVKKAAEVLPPTTRIIPMDFNSALFKQGLVEANAVINITGSPILGRFTSKHRHQVEESRIALTKNLVTAIERHHPTLPLLINASAIGIYGSHTITDDVLDEYSTILPEDYLSDLCQRWEAAASGGIKRIVRIRTGIVLDSSPQGTLSKLAVSFRLGFGGPIGIPKTWRSWIHLQDEIGLIRFALEHDSMSGPLNATAPEPVQADALAKALSVALHKPTWLPVPEGPVRLILGEAAEIITRGKRILPTKAIAAGYHFEFSTLESALHDLLR